MARSNRAAEKVQLDATIGVVVRCREHGSWMIRLRQLFAQLRAGHDSSDSAGSLCRNSRARPGVPVGRRVTEAALALHDGRGHDDGRHRGRSAVDR
jgi:hypothetical protein